MRRHDKWLRSFLLHVFVVTAVVACSKQVKRYPIPPDASRADGLVYVKLKSGDGRSAMEGAIWGVASTLMSHTERGCDYPCKRFMLYPRFSRQLEPWNGLVKTMREGEVRRVWLTLPGRTDPSVFEIELAAVVRTDSAGEPIIENQLPTRPARTTS